MTFTQQPPKTPTSIGPIFINLIDMPGNQSARYKVYILDQVQQEMDVIEGDLVPHLIPSDVTWLLDFVARMRAKAEAELLP